MSVRLSDLPADVRRKVEAELGQTRRARPSRAERLSAPQLTRCSSCGLIAPSYSKAERHLDAEHHGVGRLEVVLDSCST